MKDADHSPHGCAARGCQGGTLPGMRWTFCMTGVNSGVRLAANRDGGYPRDRLYLFGGHRHRACLWEGCRGGRGAGQALHHRSGAVCMAAGQRARTDEPPGAAVCRGRRCDCVAGLGRDRAAGRRDRRSGVNLFFLWFGAAVSVAEILTGGYLAQLGAIKGFWAIILAIPGGDPAGSA